MLIRNATDDDATSADLVVSQALCRFPAGEQPAAGELLDNDELRSFPAGEQPAAGELLDNDELRSAATDPDSALAVLPALVTLRRFASDSDSALALLADSHALRRHSSDPDSARCDSRRLAALRHAIGQQFQRRIYAYDPAAPERFARPAWSKPQQAPVVRAARISDFFDLANRRFRLASSPR